MNEFIHTLFEKVFTPFLNILCILLLSSTCLSIICRYVFHYAIIWAPEVSRFLFIFIIFVGAFLGIKHKTHISLDIVVDRLPDKVGKVIDFVRNFSMMVFFIFLAFSGFKFSIIGMSQSTQSLGFAKGWVYLIIPIGAIFMFLSTLQQTLWPLRKKRCSNEDERPG